MRVLLTLICMMFYTAYAGINVYYSGTEITSIRQGSPTEGAIYYNDDSPNWETIKTVLSTTPTYYLKVVDGAVARKTQAEIDAYDAVIAQAETDAKIARIEALDISAYDLGKALVQLGVVDGTLLKAKIKENLGVD